MKTLKDKLESACADYLAAAFCHPKLLIDKPLSSHAFPGGMDLIFSSALELTMAGRVINMKNLVAQMEMDNLYIVEKVEEQAEDIFISELMGRNSSYGDGCFAQERVIKFSQRMAIIRASEEICRIAANEDEEVADSLAKIDAQLMRATDVADTDDVESMSETLVKLHAKMERTLAGIVDPSVMTGFRELDKLTMGFKESQLIIVGGRPAMGKTAMVVQMGIHAAKNGIGTLLLSMEMDKEGIDRRNVSAELGLQRSDQFSVNEELRDTLPRVLEMAGQPWTRNFRMSERKALTIAQMRMVMTREVRRNPNLKLIIVDYLQLAKGNNSTKNRTEEIAEISRFLKAIAGELKITVMAAAQLNRNLAAREDRRPQLTDLKESGQLEQDADMVLFVHREHYYDQSANPNEAELIVAKNRHGQSPIIKIGFEGKSFSFTNDVPHWDGAPGSHPFGDAKPAAPAAPRKPTLDEILAGNGFGGQPAHG